VTPKGESPMTPEEKLLRAIFGEKARDVRDTSLKLPPGLPALSSMSACSAAAVSTKDERAMAIERAEIERLAKDRDDEKGHSGTQLPEPAAGKTAGPQGVPAGSRASSPAPTSTRRWLAEHPRGAWRHIGVQDDVVMADIETLKRNTMPLLAACRPGLTAKWKNCSAAMSCRQG